MKNIFKKLFGSNSWGKHFSETVQRVGKNNAGFSLVELIVVIAIMAVLAAVAVIGVSIYIPKAQEAADNELLNVLGDALNAACLSEGVDPSTITATIAVDADGKLAAKADGTVNLVISGTSKQDKLLELFYQICTEKNAVTKQPKGNQLKFNGKTFVWNNGSNNPTLNYGGASIELDQDDIDALKGSTYYEMGMGPLMEQLDQVTDIAAGLSNHAAMTNVFASEEFQKSAAKSFGIDTNREGWQQALLEKRDELAYELMDKDDSISSLTEAREKVMANAAVLYTAQKTAELNDEQIAAMLTSPSQDAVIENMMSDNSGQGMAQAALLCGLYTSYANSDYFPDGKDPTVSVSAVVDALDDDDFKAYLESDQGKLDLKGYLGSLNMINSSANETGAVKDMMVNGFADPDLIESLNQTIGK